MTRYEKFIESINTPEKLIQVADVESDWFGTALERGFCKEPCPLPEEEFDYEKCRKCILKYLNEQI